VRFLKANLERVSYIESQESKWYWTNFPYKVRVHKAHQIWLVGFVILNLTAKDTAQVRILV
jgi:hypothetical protein